MRHICPILASLLGIALAPAGLSGQIPDQFNESPLWHAAPGVELSEDRAALVPHDAGDTAVLYTNGSGASGEGYLQSKGTFSDQIVSFEYLAPAGSEPSVLIQGRYELSLAASNGMPPSATSAGAIAGGDNPNADGSFEAQPPLADAAKPAGEWNAISLRFRALRNDDAFNKLSNSTFLDVTLNGEIVQSDAQVPYYTANSMLKWEQTDGPLVFRAEGSPIAIRNLQVDHANFDAVRVPEPGKPTNASELVDQVEVGRTTFTSLGCIECHATKKGDTSFKTGPNLYGLFQRIPRKRPILEPASNGRFQVEADFAYAKRSMRQPAAELSIAESGPNEGEPYLPVMVPYNEELLSDTQLDAIYRYLVTLNDDGERGPVQVLVPPGGPESYDPLADPMELLVFDRTRIQRGSMKGVSGRSIHVGLPTGVNYAFDPRTLSIEKIWQGGFINGAGEWKNRGGGGFTPGYESKEIDFAGQGGLLAPLDADGRRIDFSFKEALFEDWETINASLYSEKDHLEMLSEVDARFLGYTLDSNKPDASPIFHYRVGDNRINLQTTIVSGSDSSIQVTGTLKRPQTFALNTAVLQSPEASHGTLAYGKWTLPESEKLEATLTARMGLASLYWRPEPSDTNYLAQDLTVTPTNAELPAGYRSEQFVAPRDNLGRDLLFEATGIDVAPDGTVVVGTRTSGIWRLVDGKWLLFAEGLFDCLGLVVEDENGLQMVVGQKPELTRLTDTNGDGLADRFETLSDQFSYHSNYHSYMHGPVRDAEGNYYYLLNLLHTDEAIYKGRGLYMGTSGGYSGWAIKVTPDGRFIPWASGLRSPASLGIDNANTLWYADNQGEYVGTSKLFVLKGNKFYGHPSALVDLPGMQPDSPEIQWPGVGENKETAVALFPHNLVANAPGNMTWDRTRGKFGPFQEQMFIGDQTQSKLHRVVTYKVAGETRAAVIPFGTGLQSGLMRPVFLPDGSLLIGQTGRGWQAHGGKIASLQRIVWDGKTVAPAILAATANPEPTTQITLALTQPLSETASERDLLEATSIRSWFYRDAPDYGSPELDRIRHVVTGARLADDRKEITFTLAPAERGSHPFQTSRVYLVSLDPQSLFVDAAPAALEAFITGE